MNSGTRVKTIDEGQDVTVCARVLSQQRVPLTTNDVTSITVRVWDVLDEATQVYPEESGGSSGSGPGSSGSGGEGPIFDELQTDGRWTVDARGYNLRFTVPGSVFSKPYATYDIEAAIETVEDGRIIVRVRVNTIQVRGS